MQINCLVFLDSCKIGLCINFTWKLCKLECPIYFFITQKCEKRKWKIERLYLKIIREFLFFRGALEAVFWECFSAIFFRNRDKSMWYVFSKHPSWKEGCFEYTYHILLTRPWRNIAKKHSKKLAWKAPSPLKEALFFPDLYDWEHNRKNFKQTYFHGFLR